MIRQHFGLTKDPFIVNHDAPLLAHQQRHFKILKVHSQQAGFCLILIGKPPLNTTLQLRHNHDLKSRV